MPYKVKARRLALKLSQEELAKMSGVSRATISALEAGTLKTAKTSTLIKLATALNCSVSDIFLP